MQRTIHQTMPIHYPSRINVKIIERTSMTQNRVKSHSINGIQPDSIHQPYSSYGTTRYIADGTICDFRYAKEVYPRNRFEEVWSMVLLVVSLDSWWYTDCLLKFVCFVKRMFWEKRENKILSSFFFKSNFSLNFSLSWLFL